MYSRVFTFLFFSCALRTCSGRSHTISSLDYNDKSVWGRALRDALPRVIARSTSVYYYPRLTTNSISCYSATRSAMKERCSHGQCLNTYPYFYDDSVFGVTTVCVPCERVAKHTPSEKLRLFRLNVLERFVMGSSMMNVVEYTVKAGAYHTNSMSLSVADEFQHMSLLCDEKQRCALVTPRCLEYLPLVGGSAPAVNAVQTDATSITVDVPDLEDCSLSFDYSMRDLSSVPVPIILTLSPDLLKIFHTSNASESIIRRGRTDDRCGYQRYNVTHVSRCAPFMYSTCLWCGRMIESEALVHTFNISIVEVPYFSSVMHHAASGAVHVVQTLFVFIIGLVFDYFNFIFEHFSGYLSTVFSSVVVFAITRFFLDTVQSVFVTSIYILLTFFLSSHNDVE